MFAKTLAAILASLSLAACAASPGAQEPPEAYFAKTPAEFKRFVEACKPWDDWDKPAPPFKVHGNTYYVGTCGIAAILVIGEGGSVLFDSGTEAGADVVMQNIKTLGHSITDIKALVVSHEHFDHAGGMAKLQAASGATVYAGWGASSVIRSGILDQKDPQFGMHKPMAPVANVRSVKDGEVGVIAGIAVTPIATPGHSPGAMSWQWESCEDDICIDIVYADSLSPVSRDDYKFSDHPEYLAAYEAGLERLARVDCDILLTPHPSHSRMIKRMRNNQLVEPTACAYYAIGKARDIEKRLEKEGVKPDAQ